MARSILGTQLDNTETGVLSGTILNEAGAAVDLTASTVDVFLTLYRDDTKVSINSRLNQQVVTAGVASNNHTVTAGGLLTFKLVTADTTIGAAVNVNLVARYTINYEDGAAVPRQAIQEVQFTVTPLPTIT